MTVLIIVNHGLAMVGRVSGGLIILIHSIPDQSPKNGSCGQTDEGPLRIASNRLTDKGSRSGSQHGSCLGIVSVLGIVSARGK